jgi:hypothetical protein
MPKETEKFIKVLPQKKSWTRSFNEYRLSNFPKGAPPVPMIVP